MKKLETSFLQSIQEKNHEEALHKFDEIFTRISNDNSLDDRDVKNYMIALNGIIYYI